MRDGEDEGASAIAAVAVQVCLLSSGG